MVVICILLWFIVFQPWLKSLIGNRDFQTCQTNAQKIARALTMYEGDWDDAYPPGENWTNSILGNMAATSHTGFDLQKYLKCPVDKTNRPASYVYNDLLAGINPSLQYVEDSSKETRRQKVRNPNRFPLIFEKHGQELNAHLTLGGWDDVIREMNFPHMLPEPTGILIDGSGSPKRRTKNEVNAQSGKKF